MLRASASQIRFHSIHSNPIDYPSTINTNSPNAAHPYYKHNTRHHPIAYALKIDRVNILLDAGCPLTFADSNQWLSAYARIVDSVDGVLLSGPEVITCGAVPFLRKLRPNLEIIAMSSTSKVGLFTVLSTFQNLFGNEKTFTYTDPRTDTVVSMTITTEEVYTAFQSIKEPFGFKASFSPSLIGGRGRGGRGVSTGDGDDEGPSDQQVVEARPTHNGQCLGGYIWVLSYQTDEITYAPSFSTRPSNYLKTLTRASMEAPSRCNILLTDATAASITNLPTVVTPQLPGSEDGSKKVNKADMDMLMAAMQEGLHDDHDIIIPLDATIKGVEVLNAITKYAGERSLRYPILFLFPHGDELLETVRVKTDSLNEAALGSDIADPFHRIIRVKSVAQVSEYKSPRIIVCDGADLDYGLGIEMLEELQRLSKPWTVAFTQLPAPWTNAGRLYAKFHPELAQNPTMDHTNPNVSSGVVTKYVCGSAKIEGGGGVFNKGRFGGALALSNESAISLSYTKRREYDREEQELYRANKEEAAAAAERQRMLESGGANAAMGADRIVVDVAEMSEDDEEDAAGPSSSSPKEKVQHTPGLFLPSHLSSFTPKHLVFPKVSAGAGESTVYGMALQDWERHIFATRGHVHTTTDHGPAHQGYLRNELLEYAKMPAHISFEEARPFSLAGCRLVAVDLSNTMDVRTYLRFLKGFPSAKKVVCLKGSTVDTQKHMVTPLQVEQRSRAALVSSSALVNANRRLDGSAVPRKGAMATIQYYLQNSYSGKGIELATIVAAYDVRLSPALAALAQRSLCKVQERAVGRGGGLDADDALGPATGGSRGTWEIGWLHGYVAPPKRVVPVKGRLCSEEEEEDDGRVGGQKRSRIEAVADGGRPGQGLTAEELEQADVAALFDGEEKGGNAKEAGAQSAPLGVAGGDNQAKHPSGLAPEGALATSEGSAPTANARVKKAASIKTLHPIPAALEAQALLRMEQEGIIQGSVFVGELSLLGIKSQASDVQGSILGTIASRATSSGLSGAAGGDSIASSMGGDVGADMSHYQSLVRGIPLSTHDGAEVLSTEHIQGPNQALVLGDDTIIRQQGSAGREGEDAGSAALLGDVAVEGLVSANFFAVRELVYSQFARIL